MEEEKVVVDEPEDSCLFTDLNQNTNTNMSLEKTEVAINAISLHRKE